MTANSRPHVELRQVETPDLARFFEFETDPRAIEMAAFGSLNLSNRAAFDERWTRNLSDPTVVIRTILADGIVAGSVLVYGLGTAPEVSYWLGQEFWGKVSRPPRFASSWKKSRNGPWRHAS